MQTAQTIDTAQMAELQPGSMLMYGQYRIERFLNSGGFGMTYLASDSLNRPVVIKECFPQSMCQRFGAKVSSRTARDFDQFKSIVRHFIREAHRLAQLDHPNIVGVHQVFEDNETAYMALDFVQGGDLQSKLQGATHALAPDQVRALLLTLLDAVQFIHVHGLLHCDISPDNIILNDFGMPVLIDFGAARENKTRTQRVLSSLSVVKEGYSPQEFYLQDADQGPYSDLYALGATFYHLISGRAPPSSQERLAALATQRSDPYEPLAGSPWMAEYGAEFAGAIDKSLQVLPADRFQSARDWMLAIDAGKRKEAAIELAQSDEGMRSTIQKLVREANAQEVPSQVQAPETGAEPVPEGAVPRGQGGWVALLRALLGGGARRLTSNSDEAGT